MIGGSGFNIRKILLIVLFVSGVASSLYSQGTHIGGVINQYIQVISIGIPDSVTVSDAGMFAPGDTVLLIQMKGVVVYGDEGAQYGSYSKLLGTPGGYEFLIIKSVDYGTKKIVFTSSLINSYDVYGLIQLIKVPSYDAAVVTSTLTCSPWDSVTAKTGGVLTFMVANTLTLNADIDVSGKGFTGGIPYNGDGNCVVTNLPLYSKYSYPQGYTNSGWKGESNVSSIFLAPDYLPVYPGFVKGNGDNFNGGGGGNGKYSGGGGGAGTGLGGKGGREYNQCGPPQDGGSGARLVNSPVEGNILLGGGGGSSTSAAGSSASSGGKGGGIIIIICNNLKANGINHISADGTSAGSSLGLAGAGGGGGGGSIGLYQQVFSGETGSSELKINANGGDGGNSTGNTIASNGGEGGGGGGGLILTNNLSIPSLVTLSVAPGARGTRGFGSATATSGTAGKNLTTFAPLLNGFLFNKIRSSVSNNQLDSVCSSNRPPKILGTQPIGGNGPGTYTFEWQKSYEPTFAAPVILTNDADPVNYTPALADAITPSGTVWFRRIVTSSGPLPSIDVSKPVEIIVHKKIVNNNIGDPDTVCFNGNPGTIHQLMPDLIVPTVYNIVWQDSSIAGTWGTTIGTGKDYDPSFLAATTRYRRIVTSGSCADTSHFVEMTVLNSITNNSILSPDQSICFGLPFDSLKATSASTASALGGGDNIYRFKWEANINGAGWITAQGNSSSPDYKPLSEPLEKAPANEYDYRRIVFSGTHDACADTSIKVHLRDYPGITNNIIGPDNQLFCSGSIPAKLTGLQPNNGDGNFTYTWQSKTNSQTKWNDIPGAVKIASTDYQPPALTDTTSFRRIAYATCIDSTSFARVNIHPAITGNNISLISGGADTTICNGQTPAGFTGTAPAGAIGSYTYQWLNMGESSSVYVPVTNAIGADYPNPTALIETTLYRRQVSSGACVDTSSGKITITVLLPISNNNISSVQATVCENSAPQQIAGSSPAGGGGGYTYFWEQSTDGSYWTNASGANTSASYQPPVLTQATWYRRNVISGLADCCTSLSNELLIGIDPLPLGPVNAGPDESIFSTGRTYHMKADPAVVPGESGFWAALGPGTASIVNISDSKTEVKHLSENGNLFIWTITNGLCNIEDSVTIILKPDFIPEGFSPNYDNVNDKFIIEGLDLAGQTIDLTIINGAGTVVFTSSNRNGQQWVDFEGRNNGGAELPEGTYYYMLYYTGVDQPTARKSGFIVLKRH